MLAGKFYLSLEYEDDEVVRKVGFHDGFSAVKGQIAYACDVVVVVVDQFCAVFVGYEAVILHFSLKNIFVCVNVVKSPCWGRKRTNTKQKDKK